MSCIPSIESILLQVHQSLELAPYTSNQKTAFSNLKRPLKKHNEQFIEIIDSIFRALEMHNDPQACIDLTYNIENFANFQKKLELNTWTFAADSKQIIWQLISHSYIPGVARAMAYWNLDGITDKGMPGGNFWYLPTKAANNDSIIMPVAQVCDWLLDLLAIPLDQVRNLSFETTNADTLIRNIYNWRDGKVPRLETITKSFSDNENIEFKGCLDINENLSGQEKLHHTVRFVRQKGLTPELLIHEIPITDPSILKIIIDGNGDTDQNQKFVRLMSVRYAQPSFKIIRQRLHVAKATQDGYIRLLKFLCPNISATCSDLDKNKVLQLCHIYKCIYNLTIEAYKINSDQKHEDQWFDSNLPEIDKMGLFLSIAPSMFSCSSSLLGELLTKRFQRMTPGEPLPNLFDPNPESKMDVVEQKLVEQKRWGEETIAEDELQKLIHKGSPWRVFQKENRYWVITQFAQNGRYTTRTKDAAIQRLHEIAKTPLEEASIILLEASNLLDLPQNKRPINAQEQVNDLLVNIEQHPGFDVWKAPLFCAKAKHSIAMNDIKSAVSYFKKGLAACEERSYGALRGSIARDTFATILQIQKLNSNNHEKYFREMLANDCFEFIDLSRPIELESLANELNSYFWDELYKPYSGVKKLNSESMRVYL